MNLRAAVVALAATLTPVVALGQCNSWSSVMGVTNRVGCCDPIIDAYLDNDAEFAFFANNEGAVVIYVGEDGGHVCTGWTDVDGVGLLTDGELTCRVECAEGGGFVAMVEGPGFTSQTFGVSLDGVVTTVGRQGFEHVYLRAFGHGQADLTLSLSDALNDETLSATGTDSNSDPFSVSVAAILGSTTDEGCTVTAWVGVLSGPSASVPCGGLCLSNEEGKWLLPWAEFASDTQANSLISWLTANNYTEISCDFWDAKAASERTDMLTDWLSCHYSGQSTTEIGMFACGAGSLISCGTCLFVPNPFTCGTCAFTASCFATVTAKGFIRLNNEQYEFDRVRDCICNHAAARHDNLTVPDCVFNCPSY